MNGKLIIFSAPSGAGKTTIVKQLLASDLPLSFSISACSRAIREGEINGKDYYFLSPEEFRKRIDNDEFLEWEEVYEGSYYGTLKSEVARIWDQGRHVIFDVDVVGGLNIKKVYPEKALTIFVQPPTIDELKNRLMNRCTETEESIQKRFDKAAYELSFVSKFDVVIINDNLEIAITEAKKVVNDFINQ
jgi:guanylate kinase